MSSDDRILADDAVASDRVSGVLSNRALQSPIGTAAQPSLASTDATAGWVLTNISFVSSVINTSRWNHVIYPQLLELEAGNHGFIPLTTATVIRVIKADTLADSEFFTVADAPPVAEPGSAKDASGGPAHAQTDPMDRVHFVLDVLGLAPVVGEAADLGNSVLYFAEGDVFNGTLSLAAVIPVWGSGSTVPRLSQYGDELITFGSRFDINKMHVLKGIDEQVHHLVPWELRYHDVVQIAAQDGFHMNDAANGLVLTGYQRFQLVLEELLGILFKLTPDEARSLQVRGIHASHPAYNKYVEFRLDEFANGFEAIEDITPQEARQFIEHELLTELVTETIQAANDVTRINEHFKVLLAARGWN